MDTPEQRITTLIREKAILRDQRDRNRSNLIDALGYSADHLVMLLCTTAQNPAVDKVCTELLDRLEHIARLVRPLGEYEEQSMVGFRDAVNEVRTMVAGHDEGRASAT